MWKIFVIFTVSACFIDQMRSCVFRGIKPSQCLERSGCENGKIEHFIGGFGIRVVGYVVDRHFDKEIEEVTGCNVERYDDECMRDDGVLVLECIEKYSCFGLVEIEYEVESYPAGNEELGGGKGKEEAELELYNAEGVNDLEHEKNIEQDAGIDLDQKIDELDKNQYFTEEHEVSGELQEPVHNQVPENFDSDITRLENHNYANEYKINEELEKLNELLKKSLENGDFDQVYTNLEKIKEHIDDLEKEVDKIESNQIENTEAHLYTPNTDLNENPENHLPETNNIDDLNADIQALQSNIENTNPSSSHATSEYATNDLPQENEDQIENTVNENQGKDENKYQSSVSDEDEECQDTVDNEGDGCQDEEPDPSHANLNMESEPPQENNEQELNNNLQEDNENTATEQDVEQGEDKNNINEEQTDTTQEPENASNVQDLNIIEKNNINEAFINEQNTEPNSNSQSVYTEPPTSETNTETTHIDSPPAFTAPQSEKDQPTNSPQNQNLSIDPTKSHKDPETITEEGIIEYTKTSEKSEDFLKEETIIEAKEDTHKASDTETKPATDKFLKVTTTKSEECSQDCQNICAKKDNQKDCMADCTSNFCINENTSNSDYYTVFLTGIVLFLVVGIIYLFMQNKSMRMAIEHGEFGIATYSNISS